MTNATANKLDDIADRMKVYSSPAVYLIGAGMMFQGELARFLKSHGIKWQPEVASANEVLGEVGGRVCYMSFDNPRPGGTAAYYERIKSEAHGSVMEHTLFTFIVECVSRAYSHEQVRHRIGCAYSQLSQRYVDEGVNPEYVCPPIIRNDPDLYPIWKHAVVTAHVAYVELVNGLNLKLLASPKTAELTATERRKAARGSARSVLPNATETKIQISMNARALRHFLEKRASASADQEIRAVANWMYRRALEHSPHLFRDYERTDLGDGTFALHTPTPNQ